MRISQMLMMGLTGATLVTCANNKIVARPHSICSQVDQVSRTFDDAQQRKDVNTIGDMLAPNMVYVRGSGELVDGGAFIEAFSNPNETFEPFEIVGRQIRMLTEEVAVVTAEGTIRGQSSGKPFIDRFRFSDTFVCRNGTWKIAYVQVTRLPQT